MHVRCPHCHNPMELVRDQSLSDIDCPSCGSQFSILGQETLSYESTAPRSLGHFELIEALGQGAFGTVWKSRDRELDRTVAVKIPRRDQLSATEADNFLREAQAAAQLRHPNIVSVHEVGREDDVVYIVSDFVEGVSLADWLTAHQCSQREAAELCFKIADALEHAHQAGVIHRDLKPANIMMDSKGEPHIMDFGLAKREAAEITMTMEGKVLGTPAYMSPEPAKGEAHAADRRSDIYSMGVILYELLTGEFPFRGNSRMLMHQVIHDDPPNPRKLNGSINATWRRSVSNALKKKRPSDTPAEHSSVKIYSPFWRASQSRRGRLLGSPSHRSLGCGRRRAYPRHLDRLTDSRCSTGRFAKRCRIGG